MESKTQNKIYNKHELYRYEVGDIKDPDSIKEIFLYETGSLNSYAYSILIKNFPDKINEIITYVSNHPKLNPFINEDPMLVCSLGIEGMPVRIASNINGEACGYKTDFYTSNKIRCIIECSFFNDTNGYDNGIFGGGGWDSTLEGQLGSLAIRWDKRGGNPGALDYCTEKHWYGAYYKTLQYDTWYIIDFNNSRCIIKSESGTIINNKANSPIYWTPGNEKIMSVLGGRGVRWKIGYVYDESENLIKRIVPLIKNGKVCFIDTVEGIPYTEKVGNGDLSIAYYKDGSPWYPI